jgi:hypothetical protein
MTLARAASIPIGLKISGKKGLKETGTASTVHNRSEDGIKGSDPRPGKISTSALHS